MPEHGAEFRPQRLDVAHLPEIAADRARRATLLRSLRARHWRGRPQAPRTTCSAASMPDEHRVVAALDARHVDEARRAADQRAAGEGELRHRLLAAFGDRARAIGEALAAFEQCRAISGCVLKRWNSSNGDRYGIRVIQMHDEADRHQVVVEMIEERAAAGAVVERPAEGVLHEARLVLLRLDLPELLQADAEFLRLATPRRARISRSAACDSEPRAPSANSVYLPRSSMPRVKLSFGSPSLPMPMSPVAMPRDLAVLAVDHLRRGKARIDFDAERLRLRRQPAARQRRASR